MSDALDADLTYRIRELSDLKRAIADANSINRTVLLKAMVALSYAHWEGYVKFSANKYFEFITLRKHQYAELDPQFYINSFLHRLAGFYQSKPSFDERAKVVDEIMNSRSKRFSYLPDDLINTGSNLKSGVLKEICRVCGVDYGPFEGKEPFIDVILLKRRNSIAHGDYAAVSEDEVDSIIDTVIELMRSFKNQLENKIYTKQYLAGH